MFTLFQSCGETGKQSETDRLVIEYVKKNGFSVKSDNVKNADPAMLHAVSVIARAKPEAIQ